MRLAVDMVHPADVHFFRHLVARASGAGAELLVTSRDKDITLALLDAYGIQHQCISRIGRGPAGLAAECLLRDARLLSIAGAFAPDVLIANNSPCAAHVGRVLRRPSVVFEDTEIHRVNHALYYPFVTEVHSPKSYRVDLGAKQRRYAGHHALAYLHPALFVPDRGVLDEAPADDGRPLCVVRFVGWGAMHDALAERMSARLRVALVEELAKLARVVVSAEGELPRELRKYQLALPIHRVHHLLACADLLIGESATMASEAVTLGTPAILIDARGRGYTDEHFRWGLCRTIEPGDRGSILAAAKLVLQRGRRWYGELHGKMMASVINVADYQWEQVCRLASRNGARPAG